MENKFRYVALWISGIIILVFIFQQLSSTLTDLLILNADKKIEVWRYLSSIFLHGGLAHITYNLFALILFGLILEKLIGAKRLLIVFLSTGILANIISVYFYPLSLGASGAIFGVIGALIFIKPKLPVFAFGFPMPIFIAGFLWALGDLIGAASFIAGNQISSTGNIAHLSGMVFGLIIGAIYRKPRTIIKEYKIKLDEMGMRRWEDHYMR